jgi:biopolymer transport protein ExbD
MQNFEREDLQAPLSEINMTPLVDVMLVLVVIFLVTAPIINSAINLNLPKEKAASVSEEKSIEISIDASGSYFLNDEKLDFNILQNELKFIAAKKPNHQIHLRVDKVVAYEKVAKILASLQNLGLTNIGFITENN